MSVSLAGMEYPLDAAQTPANDEVLAVFRNGGLIDIAPPGRRVRPLFYRPRPGALTYARILRSDIAVSATVQDVLLEDPFALPSVTVSCRVALNPAGDYAALRQRIKDRGLQFADAVEAETYVELDSLIRALFSQRTHEDVNRQPRPEGLNPGRTLVKGLFVIDAIDGVTITSDPHYLRVRDAIGGTQGDRAADQRTLESAARRGLSLDEFENPELRAAREQQRHELELQAAQLDLERDRLQAEITVEQIRNITPLMRAQLARGLPPGMPPVLGLPAALHVGGAGHGPVDGPVNELARDSELLRQWKRVVGARSGLFGAVRVEEGSRSLILVVLDPAAWGDRAVVNELLADAFQGEPSVALAGVPLLVDWIRELAAIRVPSALPLSPTYDVEEQDDVLRVLVGSDSGQTRAVIKALEAPETLVSPSLRQLLPYHDVTWVPRGPAA